MTFGRKEQECILCVMLAICVLTIILFWFSFSRSHFIPDWIEGEVNDASEEKNWEDATLSVSLKLIGSLTKNWRLLSTSLKACIVAWNADILRAVRSHHEKSSPSQRTLLKEALSCNLDQLITIAGAFLHEHRVS